MRIECPNCEAVFKVPNNTKWENNPSSIHGLMSQADGIRTVNCPHCGAQFGARNAQQKNRNRRPQNNQRQPSNNPNRNRSNNRNRNRNNNRNRNYNRSQHTESFQYSDSELDSDKIVWGIIGIIAIIAIIIAIA